MEVSDVGLTFLGVFYENTKLHKKDNQNEI